MEAIRVTPLHSVTHEFCIARMVTKFGLLTVAATHGLRAAKARLEQLTEAWPGEYVVYLRDTGRVIAKASTEFQRS
jgi:hypothetical protein